MIVITVKAKSFGITQTWFSKICYMEKQSFSGYEKYYKNNKIHRKIGPAETFNGEAWYWSNDDKYHRIDGPSIIEDSLKQIKFWFINDVQFAEEKYWNV